MMENQRHYRAESAQNWRTNSGRNSSSGSFKRHSSGNEYNKRYGDLPTSFCGRGSGDCETRHNYENLEQIVHDYFDKKFYFQPPMENWTLPPANSMFVDDKWQERRLQVLKDELNRVKSKLDSFNLNDWHKHTRMMNKAGEIQWKLRSEIEPEFLTQAWCKFYENAMSSPLVPPVVVKTGVLNSVHLCEAPGAFITSLNHYLRQHHPGIKWDWQANTLNPYYEGNPLCFMINDDRFILQTLSHWKFGLDYTGNLMDLENMKSLVKDAAEMGDVLLVTADGSIDCQEDPGEQEAIVSSLHYCETVAALHILAPGGSFLLKMFTMYESETVCLMYLLCCAFTSVRVCKPATSKEGNSEVYVVCLEYKGRDALKPWLSVLRQYFGPDVPKKAMFSRSSIPEDFINQLHECASLFKKYQTDVIETNIRVYTGCKMKGEVSIIRRLRNMIADHFMEVYEMKRLESSKDEVVGKGKLKRTMTLNMDPRAEDGTFDDKRKKAKLEPLELLKVLKEEVTNVRVEWPHEEEIGFMDFPECVKDFEIKMGKPVKKVESSKFCLGRLLKIRNQVRSIVKKLMHRSDSENSDSGKTSPKYQNGMNLSDKSELSEKLKSSLDESYGRQELVIINFKERLWTSVQNENEAAEQNAFYDIMDIVDNLWRDQNLLVQGYPMLTQFNVGIVYMLCHLFEKVGFVKPYKQDFGIIFCGFRKWNPKMKKFLEEVEDTIQRLDDEGRERTVLSLFPINKLCERYSDTDTSEKESNGSVNNGEEGSGDCKKEKSEVICDNIFYKSVTEVNHLCVKEQILDIISNVLQE